MVGELEQRLVSRAGAETGGGQRRGAHQRARHRLATPAGLAAAPLGGGHSPALSSRRRRGVVAVAIVGGRRVARGGGGTTSQRFPLTQRRVVSGTFAFPPVAVGGKGRGGVS